MCLCHQKSHQFSDTQDDATVSANIDGAAFSGGDVDLASGVGGVTGWSGTPNRAVVFVGTAEDTASSPGDDKLWRAMALNPENKVILAYYLCVIS